MRPAAAAAKPRFSVLMANFNRAEYLGEAIGSVVRQTLEDWELVVVDDASTDSSWTEIERLARGEPRLRPLSNRQNVGYIGTLRRLVAESRGEILAVLDSDDALTEDALASIDEVYRADPEVGLVYSQCILCDAALRDIEVSPYSRQIPEGSSSLHLQSVTALRTFRRSAYDETSGYGAAALYAEDQDLVYKLEEVTELRFVEKALYRYRHLPDSQSHDPRKNAIGRSSVVTTAYHAYLRRRRGTRAPNIAKAEMLRRLWLSAKRDAHWRRYLDAARHLLRALHVLALPERSGAKR